MLIDETCRVCGWSDPADPEDYWHGGVPLYAICDCCGSESGVEDVSWRTALRARKAWVDAGARWFAPEARPADWDLVAQLQRVRSRRHPDVG
ncbi:hypothetical protein [Oerskovia paurometabola]|uniref:Uncharacterized protein n=1 Tax=Oerskovia paurometabola TaxID=162170 RepID=A0ABW1XCJ7_9CELL|nr:hypothetical protein [Oerskovia paurometabola]MBM7496745.1 hypothetical protein [Oerskovia paurometabola]